MVDEIKVSGNKKKRVDCIAIGDNEGIMLTLK